MGLPPPPLASVVPFLVLRPTLGAPPGNAKEGVVTTAHLRWMCDRPSARVVTRLQGQQRPPGTGAETTLDSCTNLCTPLYICYIECIYVGNMLASPVCRRRRASLSTGPLPGRGLWRCPPSPRSHHRPKPVPASPSACLSVSSALSTL